MVYEKVLTRMSSGHKPRFTKGYNNSTHPNISELQPRWIDYTLGCTIRLPFSTCGKSPQVLLSVYCDNKTIKWLTKLVLRFKGVSLWMQGTWELKYVLVLSNAQPYDRVLSIYSSYMREPHNNQDVVLTGNKNCYAYRRRNMSLA